MEGRRYWLKSGLLTLLEKGSGLVFAFGTAILLLRSLSKAEFATWGMFLLISYFSEMGRSGFIQNGLIRHLTLHRDAPSDYEAISSASLLLNLLFSVATNLVLWLGGAWLADTCQVPALADLIPLYCISSFVLAFLYHFNFVQQANLEFRGIFWGTFFQRGLLFVWVVTAKIAGFQPSLASLALATLAGSAVGAVASWLYAKPFLAFNARIRVEWVAKLASYGKFVLGTNLSTMFYKSIDKLTLSHLIGPSAFAVYDAAGKVTQLVETPSFSMAALVFPKSVQRLETEGTDGIAMLYERSVGAILTMILPFLIAVLVFAEPIIWIFAGPAYMESANVLRLTAFFGLFLPFAVQSGTILDASGKPEINFAFTTVTAMLNLTLSFWLIARFGLFGAAYATLLGYLLNFIVVQIALKRFFGIRWWKAFRHIPGFYKLGFELIKTGNVRLRKSFVPNPKSPEV